MATATKKKTDKNPIKLFEVGCLVNLKVHMWSGRKMLTRADLVKVGYDPDQLPEDIVNLGRKLMVPKEELQALTRIEQRARKALERWSVPFGIASAHFVPNKMLPTVEQQIKGLREEFFTVADSFISRFDDLTQAVRKAHPDFWEKCLKGQYPTSPKLLTTSSSPKTVPLILDDIRSQMRIVSSLMVVTYSPTNSPTSDCIFLRSSISLSSWIFCPAIASSTLIA